jgi:hypothetical protein
MVRTIVSSSGGLSFTVPVVGSSLDLLRVVLVAGYASNNVRFEGIVVWRVRSPS